MLSGKPKDKYFDKPKRNVGFSLRLTFSALFVLLFIALENSFVQ